MARHTTHRPRDKFHPPRSKYARRKWLNHNPNASIEHVAQTPDTRGGYGDTRRVLVTILYHD